MSNQESKKEPFQEKWNRTQKVNSEKELRAAGHHVTEDSEQEDQIFADTFGVPISVFLSLLSLNSLLQIAVRLRITYEDKDLQEIQDSDDTISLVLTLDGETCNDRQSLIDAINFVENNNTLQMNDLKGVLGTMSVTLD